MIETSEVKIPKGTSLNSVSDDAHQVSTETGGKSTSMLNILLSSNATINEAASGQIVYSTPWLTHEETPIIQRGTLNIVQGKSGSHKSRLSEGICSVLLSHDKIDFLGFEKSRLGAGYCIAYIDTERNTTEDFPAAIQRIRQGAGFEKTSPTKNLYPVSIKAIERIKRLDATREWIDYVRNDMLRRGIGDWHLFIVLDVVTDCVRSFNNDADTLSLFDYVGNLCEEFNVSFLLVLHENPGTDKARGHTGTEGMNKANTQIQIGYEKGKNGEETDIIKIKFLKCRNSARPMPIYAQFSKSVNGLVLADPEAVRDVIREKQAVADIESVIEHIEQIFDRQDDIVQRDLIEKLSGFLGCSDNTIKSRLDQIERGKTIVTNKEGKGCYLVADRQKGKQTVYSLQIVDNEQISNKPEF